MPNDLEAVLLHATDASVILAVYARIIGVPVADLDPRITAAAWRIAALNQELAANRARELAITAQIADIAAKQARLRQKGGKRHGAV